MKLNTKLTLSFVGIVTFAVAIILVVAVHNSQRALEVGIGNDLQHIAQAAARQIDAFIESEIITTRILSQADVFEAAAAAAAAEEEKEEKVLAINAYLSEIVEADPDYDSIFVFDNTGAVVASTMKEKIGQSINNLGGGILARQKVNLFEKALNAKQGDVFFQDALKGLHSKGGDHLTVEFFTPITDSSNINVIYVLVVFSNFDHIQGVVSSLDDQTIGDKWTYLVNDPGEVLFSLDKAAQILTPLADIRVRPTLVEALEGDKDGYVAYEDIIGDDVLAGYADLGEYGINQGGDWSVISMAPIKDIFAPVTKLINSILVVGAVVVVITFLLAFLISRAITGPINVVVDGVKKIGRGNLNHKIKMRSQDEVGELAKNVNQMAEQLSYAQDELKNKTSRLTLNLVEIEKKNTQMQKTKDAMSNVMKEFNEEQRNLKDQKYALDQHSIVAITNNSGKITYVNDKFCKISKYSEQELLGQDHRIINSGYHPKEFIADLWKTIANGKVWKGEIKNKAKGGSFYWVDTTIVPFLNEKGKPVQYLAIRTDITERKEDEIRLKDTTEDLSRSNRDLEQFAYVASHDLQEPLRMVASFTQLLDRRYGKQLDEKAKEYIKYAVDGSKRMQRLVDDLLKFSRVGQKDIKFVNVDLNKIIAQISQDLGVLIKNTNAKISYQSLPVLQTDESQMIHLFQNFITNAIKFRREDPLIKIEYRESANEHQFSVSDNGMGIEKKYQDKIFVIFQRLHTREEFEGTGIGLALCKKIVENYGGQISVESEMGKGTTFHFTFKKGV